MAMTATTQHVSAQTQIQATLNDNNFIHIKQKKRITRSEVCTNFDSSIDNWSHPATGESPVSISYVNLWDDASDPKSVKMTVTMSPGYRPQLYDSLYHFIQISPTETYDRFEAEAAVDGNVHLTSAEMTMLYSDVNFAAKSAELEEYCRLQIPTEDIIQDTDNGKLTFTKIVTLNFLKTCAEQKHSLVLKRTANTDADERCKYVTHPSTNLVLCGDVVPNGASTADNCMKECDASVSCNAFTFDAIQSTCSLYPGTGLNLDNGNFDVSNTANNLNCRLAVPSSGTDMTAYLLDPHTVAGKCYQYVYDTGSSGSSGQVPTRRLAGALTSARQLAFDSSVQPYMIPYITGSVNNIKPAARVPMSPNDAACAVQMNWKTGFRFNPSATGYNNVCGRFKLRSFQVADADVNPMCGNMCATDPYCQYAMYSAGGICEHFSYGSTCWSTYEAKPAWNIARIDAGMCEDSTRSLSTELSTQYAPLSTCGVSGTGNGGYDFGGGHSASSTCTSYGTDSTVTNKQECMNDCGLDVNCLAIQFNPNTKMCRMFEHGLFYGMSGNSCGPTAYDGTVNNHFWTKTQYYVPGKNDDCYPSSSGATGAPTTASPTVPGATNAPTIAATNAPTVPPVAGGQSGATNAPTAAATPPWHTDQTYNDQRLQIDFVVTSVQCKCPTGSNIGDNLEHCDVPFYQKVTFTRAEDEDHTASTGTLIISDSNLYLLPVQDILVNNDLEEMSVEGTAFNFGDATIGISDPNACKPVDSTTSAFVDCGGAKAFIKPFQREEPMTISFKSDSALQMQSVTLKTFDDSEMTVDGNTACNLIQGSTTDGTYGTGKKCTVETFYAPDDVNWHYADPGYDLHTPSQAYSFTFLGAEDDGPLDQAYDYYDDDNLVLNVIVKTTVSQAGARVNPSRRRLGAASSIQLIGDNSRSLRLLAEDSRSVETVVLSLPVLPMMDGGGGGLGGLNVGSSNSTNGTVQTFPQTIINQYHTTHNDGESAGTISLVLSAVAVTLVVSGMAVWGIRRFQSSKAHKSGASSDHGMKVSSESQSYGESTPMLSMRGLHVA